jgi:hypothetical protein
MQKLAEAREHRDPLGARQRWIHRRSGAAIWSASPAPVRSWELSHG